MPRDDVPDLQLRAVEATDLPDFFRQQLDPAANHMAAFTRADPADRSAFDEHWTRILNDKTIVIRTVVAAGSIVGYVLCYHHEGRPELSYWIGREYWGQGIATDAVRRFLDHVVDRPLYARAAKDNLASIRVLVKNGFTPNGHTRGFSNARGKKIEEIILIRAGLNRRA